MSNYLESLGLKTDNSTYKLGVIGDPIGHTLSPKIHNIFAKQAKIKIDYQPYHVLPENLDSFIKDFFIKGGDGLNVTLPHKINCLRSVWGPSARVKFIGAANTLKYIRSSDKIMADSTDGPGLVQDLKDKFKLFSANVLILGAGGSASSIIPSIEHCSPTNIILDNRSQEKIQTLINRFDNDNKSNYGLPPGKIPHKIVHIDNFEGEIDLVINATSAGFSGPFKWHRELNINKKTVFYDLSYSNSEEKTPFLDWANQYSDNYHDGFGMLINQAALSFEYWTGKKPDTKITKTELYND
ncbi:shikimate dehydrogenase [Gammaproteobacteria bacterium]|jgi:shikimate dehydrogenase|nr:shikimate dehydrogenase [Gammaproteobacteria bacterium]